MKKTFKSETVHVCKEENLYRAAVAHRLGVIGEHKTICPGCGKLTKHDSFQFDVGVFEGRIREINTPNAHGMRWCDNCR